LAMSSADMNSLKGMTDTARLGTKFMPVYLVQDSSGQDPH
jgi:hypothetical protein